MHGILCIYLFIYIYIEIHRFLETAYLELLVIICFFVSQADKLCSLKPFAAWRFKPGVWSEGGASVISCSHTSVRSVKRSPLNGPCFCRMMLRPWNVNMQHSSGFSQRILWFVILEQGCRASWHSKAFQQQRRKSTLIIHHCSLWINPYVYIYIYTYTYIYMYMIYVHVSKWWREGIPATWESFCVGLFGSQCQKPFASTAFFSPLPFALCIGRPTVKPCISARLHVL